MKPISQITNVIDKYFSIIKKERQSLIEKYAK